MTADVQIADRILRDPARDGRTGILYLSARVVLSPSAYRPFHADVPGTLPAVRSIASCIVMARSKDDRA